MNHRKYFYVYQPFDYEKYMQLQGLYCLKYLLNDYGGKFEKASKRN